MFDMVNEAAERLATRLSRRGFRGPLGPDANGHAKGGVKMIRSGGLCPPGYIYCFGHCLHWTHILWCG